LWDYSIASFPIYPYPAEGFISRAVLDVICLAFLSINSFFELKGLYQFSLAHFFALHIDDAIYTYVFQTQLSQ